jgi:hypothetical protein
VERRLEEEPPLVAEVADLLRKMPVEIVRPVDIAGAYSGHSVR